MYFRKRVPRKSLVIRGVPWHEKLKTPDVKDSNFK